MLNSISLFLISDDFNNLRVRRQLTFCCHHGRTRACRVGVLPHRRERPAGRADLAPPWDRPHQQRPSPPAGPQDPGGQEVPQVL